MHVAGVVNSNNQYNIKEMKVKRLSNDTFFPRLILRLSLLTYPQDQSSVRSRPAPIGHYRSSVQESGPVRI
jgi:hypothetical protein